MLTLLSLLCIGISIDSVRPALTVEKMNTANLERDDTTTDLNSLAWQVANDFHLEISNVTNHFRLAKYSRIPCKGLLFRIDFN